MSEVIALNPNYRFTLGCEKLKKDETTQNIRIYDTGRDPSAKDQWRTHIKHLCAEGKIGNVRDDTSAIPVVSVSDFTWPYSAVKNTFVFQEKRIQEMKMALVDYVSSGEDDEEETGDEQLLAFDDARYNGKLSPHCTNTVNTLDTVQCR